MSDRRLFALVVAGCVGVTAAGTSRGPGWSPVLAAALEAWAAGRGRAGAAVAAGIALVAWAVAGAVTAGAAVLPSSPRRNAVAGAAVERPTA